MAAPPGHRRGSMDDEVGDEPHSGLSLDVPVELIKDPRSWTVEDITIWLHWLGIGEHAEAFAAQGIDGRSLLQLSAESAWADLGVVDPSQQRVLDSAVEPLRCFRDSEGAESGLALHAIEGPVQGEVFFIGAGGITGGRHSASNGVVLSENYVSRRHFQITRDFSGQHLLQDVGSTTGTFLMVREELPLEHLMVLQLGTTELTVQMDGDQCRLVATEGPDKDAQAVVPAQGVFIGREACNGLCIRDPQISAFHCEVKPSPEHGFVLDDKYSTNRTWLRLAPDGQPSKRFPLRAGDLFKVGSTLFHVVDPATVPGGAPGSELAAPSAAPAAPLALQQEQQAQRRPSELAMAGAGGGAAPPTPLLAQQSPSVPGSSPRTPVAGGGAGAGAGGGVDHEVFGDEEPLGQQDDSFAEGSDHMPVPQLRWEPCIEGEEKPSLSAEEYAARLTASRRQVQALHAGASARRNWTPGGGGGADLHLSQDGLLDVRERELSSLQQRMRNSRAQTAYTLNQESTEERKNDEDLCKICYDRDIDVVLYPCGHFILCRWCAQKVSDCPVCRFVITDVIRTYKA